MIMEFASYLEYLGVPVEGGMGEAGGPNSVIVVTRAITKDGLCKGYRNFICHTAAMPDTGDLVIVLPDDKVWLADVTPYQGQGELLFSYEPGIPQWVYPFLRRLPIVSPGPLAQTELPDGWLYASVTRWK
jgi:hypothetical protein